MATPNLIDTLAELANDARNDDLQDLAQIFDECALALGTKDSALESYKAQFIALGYLQRENDELKQKIAELQAIDVVVTVPKTSLLKRLAKLYGK